MRTPPRLQVDQASRPEAQIFLLSPASCSGLRARLVMGRQAEFFLARQLRDRGATLGEVFSFLSGLYFRGKLAYARAFARSPAEITSIWIISAGRGLLSPETIVTGDDLEAFRGVPIDANEPRYCEPLARDAAAVSQQLGPQGRAILLGSVATAKYTGVLQAAFGDRLLFPKEFIGRGDLSRGGLLLRHVDEGRELNYVPIGPGLHRGKRPCRLPPRG